jgi:DNA mismatch repair protein MutS
MASAMRFTCPALAELDRRVAEAGDRAGARERACIAHLKRLALAAGTGISAAARALAELDLHAAAAVLAAEGGLVPAGDAGPSRVRSRRRPPSGGGGALKRARGPAFVPNDCDLSAGRRLCLLTGPNMAGKSTCCRQNAIRWCWRRPGCSCRGRGRMGLVDRLFSRVGGGDDIAGGGRPSWWRWRRRRRS